MGVVWRKVKNGANKALGCSEEPLEVNKHLYCARGWLTHFLV